jgi:hypothetical protein
MCGGFGIFQSLRRKMLSDRQVSARKIFRFSGNRSSQTHQKPQDF